MKAYLVLTACLLISTGAAAEDGSVLSTMVENDSFIPNSDRHYTNGLYVSWTSAPERRDDDVAGYIRDIMPDGGPDESWRTSWFGGQNIYTPQNLRAKIPAADDQPYAGWLYGGARLYRDRGDVLDTVEVELGIVGPSSLASALQIGWHKSRLLGGAYPAGWHYQLHGEPGVMLGEQRIWRVKLSDGWLETEVLPQLNARVGNIYTYGAAGATLRIGSGLKSDWGPPRIEPGLSGADFQASDAFGWYLFAGVEGRAIARNIFLDGSSFQDSPRVGHKVLAGDVTAGAAILFPGMRLMGSYTARSREFRGQAGEDQMVALTLSIAN